MSQRSIVFVSLAALLILVVGIGAAACGTAALPPGGDSSSTSTTGPTSSSTETSSTDTSTSESSTTLPAGAISHPTGADQLVMRVEVGGGFVPIEYNFTAVPQFNLYGDGRVVVPGPETMQYPGPALPNLQSTVLTEDGIQAILAAAKDAGLFQNGVDYGQPGVTDVGTTTITINADGATYTSQIYALGFEDGGNLTMQQQQARAAINDLAGRLSDPAGLVGTELQWEPYEFTALEVYSRPVDPVAATSSTDIQPNHLPWPLADLATSGEEVPNSAGMRKLIVTGADLETLSPLLDQATDITLWKSGDTQYNLWFRPLLPDEAAGVTTSTSAG
jgi:hypothetical protein